MAKRGRTKTREGTAKTEEGVIETTNDVDADGPSAANKNGPRASLKKGSKRGSSKDETEPPSKKKKGKADENGDANSRPRRACATKAADELKSILSTKKGEKKGTRKSPGPKKAPSQFEVESIIDSRKRKGRMEYKIRWKGYTASSDTWEPERNLSCPEILDAWKADHKKKDE